MTVYEAATEEEDNVPVTGEDDHDGYLMTQETVDDDGWI